MAVVLFEFQTVLALVLVPVVVVVVVIVVLLFRFAQLFGSQLLTNKNALLLSFEVIFSAGRHIFI